MNKLNVGLIGFGNVGSGVAKLLQKRKKFIKNKVHTEIILQTVCDRIIHSQNTKSLEKVALTSHYQDVLNNPNIDVVIELIGGMYPAKEIVIGALKNGKHVVTANKELIAQCGRDLFQLANSKGLKIYYESAVGAGVPIIKTITEGLAGNKFNSLYGIINGTCNFILSEMTKNNLTFSQALKEAQERGFAESNPTLDINGMDSAHKLAILIFLALGKPIKLSDIYVEGITHISHADIEYAKEMGLTIKLLAIAKNINNKLEARVHPTLISRDHLLASVSSIFNAIFLAADPLGDVLLYGQGAGQMAAASGVVSDLINLATNRSKTTILLSNSTSETSDVTIQEIDQIQTKFYIRFMAIDKPGVLSKISGILGKQGISIASVKQKANNKSSSVPVVMLTDYAPERMVRLALDKIHKLSVVKSKPVAIRMEKLL